MTLINVMQRIISRERRSKSCNRGLSTTIGQLAKRFAVAPASLRPVRMPANKLDDMTDGSAALRQKLEPLEHMG